MAVEPFDDAVIAARAEVRPDHPLRVHGAMDRPDVVPRPVVPDDTDDRQAVTHERVVFHAVEAERSVAEHNANPGIRFNCLGRDREWRAHTEATERTGVEEAADPRCPKPLCGRRDDVAAISGNDRVVTEEVRDFPSEAFGMDRCFI